jgi:deazaflavin-dependent oxidoreductase (nitroreductase family)
MTDLDDWNTKIITEFRANAGKVGGPFEGAPLLLLHSIGAKSGQVRVNPLTYQAAGDRLVIFASKAGATTNPDWYHNLKANPAASVEVGTEHFEVVARVAEGEERDHLWTRQKEAVPTFAAYEARAGREIPVVVLERA